MSPLWRRAPLRVLSTGVAGLLLVLAMGVAVGAAASAPLFAQSAGDSALRAVLAAVPDNALADSAPVVRLVGGQTLRSEDQSRYVEMMRRIPGLDEPVVTGVSVTPEVEGGLYPVVRANGITAAARLAAVSDPAEALVVTGTGTGQVWLPDPLAAELQVHPGDTVVLALARNTLTAPPLPADAHAARVRVAGTYAVSDNGRTPADPPGTRAWSARRGALPSDTDHISQPAYLIVGDVDTIDSVSKVTADQVLWAVESRLDPSVSLAVADQAAAQIAELRKDARSSQGSSEGVLRVGLVSGVEELVAQADGLAAASTQRARLWSSAGMVAGLAAVLAVALLAAADRRRELAHGVATGVGPGRTAGLWAVETALPAALAVAVGVGAAVLGQVLLDPDGGRTTSVQLDALRAGVTVALVAVVLVALVGLAGSLVVERPQDERTMPRAPWLVALAVATGVALLAALTGPTRAPGPVEVATPILLAATAGTVVALVGRWVAHRLPGGPRLPSPRGSGRWLARRRLAALGSSQVMLVAAVTVGLAMAMFAAASVQATRTVVSDREAVAAGARSIARIEGSWRLDPTAPKAPTADEVADGAKVPLGHSPDLPPDQAPVWRSSVSVTGLFGYRDLLVTDPERFSEVAAWGRGSDLAAIRDDVRGLAEPVAQGEATPVIAVGDPSLSPGDSVVISGQEWQVPVTVVASVDTFPDKGEVPMLVAAADVLFPQLGYLDPRLVPPAGGVSPRPYVETSIWSSASVAGLAKSLQDAGVTSSQISSGDQAAQQPAFIAATFTQGYQGALAAFFVLGGVVAAGLYASRTARRNRAADLLLARVGMRRQGVRAARSWELVVLILLAALAAIGTVFVLRPLGRLLVDLDPGALPVLRLQIGAPAWLALLVATAAVLVGAFGVSWLDGRAANRPGAARSEEAVLRAAD